MGSTGALSAIVSSLAAFRADEVPCLFAMRKAGKHREVRPEDPDMEWCYDVLVRVSRSFAIVIQQLDPKLRDAVCLFYLVLRGLDTVEDDMKIEINLKLKMLRGFTGYIEDPEWRYTPPGTTGHYLELMEQFPKVTRSYLKLDKPLRDVISDVTGRMAEGMAEFVIRDKDGVRVESLADYDKYCHYVAGLVGIGLSNLFFASGLEMKWFKGNEYESNQMGLFLQKVNITRDYLEDIVEVPPRAFWPKAIWGKYADNLEDFQVPRKREDALRALNDMVTDALQHAPVCLTYMEHVRTPSVLRFCAIPQIMAIATLAEIYGNPRVFQGVVKIRKGLSAKIVVKTEDIMWVYGAFWTFARRIRRRAKSSTNPSDAEARGATIEACTKIIAICGRKLRVPDLDVEDVDSRPGVAAAVSFFAAFCQGYYLILKEVGANRRPGIPLLTRDEAVKGALSLYRKSHSWAALHERGLGAELVSTFIFVLLTLIGTYFALTRMGLTRREL